MMEQNGYAVDYGDAYMEQEEEWEREGLLDPAWEKQQKKVMQQHNHFIPVSIFAFHLLFLSSNLVIFVQFISSAFTTVN